MRMISMRFLACAVCVLAPVSVLAQLQPPPQQEEERDQSFTAHGLAKVIEPRIPSSLDAVLDKEVAGLAAGRHPEVLTWERVYALALVRARGGARPRTESLDPKALAEQAARYGVADFARFRKEFLAAGSRDHDGLRDPSDDLLALLGRLKGIDHTRQNVTFYENIFRLMSELAKGESSGVTQLNLDQVEDVKVKARQNLDHQIAEYRNRLDRFKVALGLSVRAPVVLDRESVASFGRAFDQARDWQMRPDRTLRELPQIIKRLPALGEVTVDGRPILTLMGGNPDQQEEVLTRAARLAIQNRSDLDKGGAPGDAAAAALEVNVRRRIRRLFELRRDYEAQQRRYELSIRLLDQGLEQIFAQSKISALAISARVASGITGLLAPENQRLNAEGQLTTLWTSFQMERLALYRELGSLPYDDWNSFYKDLSAR